MLLYCRNWKKDPCPRIFNLRNTTCDLRNDVALLEAKNWTFILFNPSPIHGYPFWYLFYTFLSVYVTRLWVYPRNWLSYSTDLFLSLSSRFYLLLSVYLVFCFNLFACIRHLVLSVPIHNFDNVCQFLSIRQLRLFSRYLSFIIVTNCLLFLIIIYFI